MWRGGAGVAGLGDMHDGAYAWQGVCVVGALHGKGACVAGGCAWQERRSLQRAVCILLECILVIPVSYYKISFEFNIFNIGIRNCTTSKQNSSDKMLPQ